MTRFRSVQCTVILAVSAGLALAGSPAKSGSTPVTFNKEVLPVLQKNCQGCHRPGEAAPFSMLTYKTTRPWAASIKESVLSKKMPPWFADPQYGHFANNRSLSQAEIDTLVAWTETGAKEGDPKDAPKPIEFVEGWNIGKPDMVFEMPKAYEIPAAGTIAYQYVVIPTGFTEDKWIERAESRPGNRALTHHVIAFIREPGSQWMKDAKPGEFFEPEKHKGEGGFASGTLTGYAPGTMPEILKPGQAKLVKAGSDLVLQLHYTANGKPSSDKTSIGVVFAKQPPKERIAGLVVGTPKFAIPAGAGNHPVEAKLTLQSDATLLGMLPHMHLRGKSFQYRVVRPNGEKEILLNVPNYSFSWQLTYKLAEPMHLPAGTVIEATAHFDNSANNPNNPDATKEVRYGDQSWEEMMFGFMTVSIDPAADPIDLVRPKKAPAKAGD